MPCRPTDVQVGHMDHGLITLYLGVEIPDRLACSCEPVDDDCRLEGRVDQIAAQRAIDLGFTADGLIPKGPHWLQIESCLDVRPMRSKRGGGRDGNPRP